MQIASKQCFWNTRTIPKDKTVLFVEATDASMTVRIAHCVPAVGSSAIEIDWGDGVRQSFPSVSGALHTYARRGEYRIVISDDVREFAYVDGSGSGIYNDMLRELANVGPKVTIIGGYAFNNCHNMRGVINLPGVTEIGSYAFGTTLGITDFIMPSMRRLVQTSFYAGPSPRQMHVDNVETIDGSFFGYYGNNLEDMYIGNKTCDQIKAMSGFPFEARASVRFHGSNGIILGNGTCIA